MDLTELKIGTKLELELFNESGVRMDYTLISRFEWLLDENSAMIAAPIHEGLIYPIRTGTEMNIYLTAKLENVISLYRFKARVTGRDTVDNLALLRIEAESGFEKVQRRKYFRLECSVAVKYRIVDSFNEFKNEGIQFKKSLAINLSGGGICLLLEEKIDVGKLVECEITTYQNRVIRFFGKVIRYEKNQVESRFKFLAGIAYIKINENDREAVVKFIFNEQRILRQKGLI